MKFTKMQGTGNDFILINNIEENIPAEKLPTVAKRLCSRRLSIGADGLIAIDKAASGGDYRMLFYNSDGSTVEMCGNGALCVCRYGYELGLAGETQKVETAAGFVTGHRENERIYTVRLNDPSVIKLDYPVSAGDVLYQCSYVELGNPGLPHAVVLYEGIDRENSDTLRKVGSLLRHNSAFPKGANVNFCEMIGKNNFRVRTFERGVENLTLACGTGAASTAAVMTLLGKTDGKNVRISTDGGDLYINLSYDGKNVKDIFLTGTTNIVACGEIRDEDFTF